MKKIIIRINAKVNDDFELYPLSQLQSENILGHLGNTNENFPIKITKINDCCASCKDRGYIRILHVDDEEYIEKCDKCGLLTSDKEARAIAKQEGYTLREDGKIIDY